MKLSVKKIVELCNGNLICGNPDIVCCNLVKDTRNINKGDTFIGIKGDNYNGTEFYKDAISNGANCVILEKKYFKSEEMATVPIVLVDNTIEALKNISSYIRNQSKAIFIGVTGSVGKTSTRDIIYSVVKEKYTTLKTENNYNNNIGLPLTITKLNDEQAAVIEMGMNHLKEISYLSKITKPNIGVITNVGTAHIGELGSRENILKAKLEILDGMDCNGKLVINNDNDLLHEYYLKNKNQNIITIGINNDSDFVATDIETYENYSKFNILYKGKKVSIICNLPGKHFIYNSLIAFAVGKLLNVETKNIVEGIKNFELTANRLEIIELKNNIKIINGVYNASLDSMKSSLDILKQQKNRKIAVLGSMLELGYFSKELHEEVGNYVVKNNIDILITVGLEAKNIGNKALELGFNSKNLYCFENNLEAINILKEIIKNGDCILLKASNGLKFIEILNEIINFCQKN